MGIYAKAIVALLAQITALSTAFAVALQDGIITTAEWSGLLPLLIATIVVPIGVYIAPNASTSER